GRVDVGDEEGGRAGAVAAVPRYGLPLHPGADGEVPGAVGGAGLPPLPVEGAALVVPGALDASRPCSCEQAALRVPLLVGDEVVVEGGYVDGVASSEEVAFFEGISSESDPSEG